MCHFDMIIAGRYDIAWAAISFIVPQVFVSNNCSLFVPHCLNVFFFVLTYPCNHLPVSHFYAHLWFKYHFAASWIELNGKSHYAWCLASHVAYTCFWMSVSFLVNTHFATITSHLLYATIHHGSCQVKKKYFTFSTLLPSDIYKMTRPNGPFNSVIYWDQSSSFKLHSEPQNSFNFPLVPWMSKWTTTMPASLLLCLCSKRLRKRLRD